MKEVADHEKVVEELRDVKSELHNVDGEFRAVRAKLKGDEVSVTVWKKRFEATSNLLAELKVELEKSREREDNLRDKLRFLFKAEATRQRTQSRERHEESNQSGREREGDDMYGQKRITRIRDKQAFLPRLTLPSSLGTSPNTRGGWGDRSDGVEPNKERYSEEGGREGGGGHEARESYRDEVDGPPKESAGDGVEREASPLDVVESNILVFSEDIMEVEMEE